MLRRVSLLLLVIVALMAGVVSATPTRAQDALKYGDTIPGEITADALSKSYTFEGKQGELAFVHLILLEGDSSNTLDAQIQLKSPDGTVIADTASFSYTVIGAYADAVAQVLPADGTYTIDIAASAIASDDSKVGKYELQLINPPALEPGKPVDVASAYKGFSRFLGVYQVRTETAYTLNLTQDSAQGITLLVHAYTDFGVLSQVRAEGKGVSSITLAIAPPTPFHLITVAASDYFGSETEVKFTIGISQ